MRERKRERVCVCGGILLWKGDLVITIAIVKTVCVCVCVVEFFFGKVI